MFGELAPRERGTVFLDEVGDLPPAIQTKLLRVLEDRCVLRIGERVPKKVDVRFVAATNRDLRQEIARRSFREDLYYRLSGVTFTVPLLRERRSESLPLAEVFATRARVEQGHSPGVSWSPSARELLEGYDWPGNVRELKNAIERGGLVRRLTAGARAFAAGAAFTSGWLTRSRAADGSDVDTASRNAGPEEPPASGAGIARARAHSGGAASQRRQSKPRGGAPWHVPPFARLSAQ